MKKRIAFFHMLNDYSGSPHVLALIIKGLVERGYNVDLYTSSSNRGFLSGLKGVKYHNIFYEFTTNKIRTFILFFYAQICYFIIAIKLSRNKTTIYINTILPFGATLGAALINMKVIYHIHEKPVKQNFIQRIALKTFQNFSHKRIFVSRYLKEQYNDPNKNNILIYNSLSKSFSSIALQHKPKLVKPFTILMVCSLRKYKGVDVFRELAFRLTDYNFILVLNASDSDIASYFQDSIIPNNLKINSTQTSLHPYFSQSHLVLNLSIPHLWIETFGLTALEAMAYGIPVIVPPIGGIAEIIDDGIEGFKVNSTDKDLLINRIDEVLSNEQRYYEMSINARLKADSFSYTNMIDDVEKAIN